MSFVRDIHAKLRLCNLKRKHFGINLQNVKGRTLLDPKGGSIALENLQIPYLAAGIAQSVLCIWNISTNLWRRQAMPMLIKLYIHPSMRGCIIINNRNGASSFAKVCSAWTYGKHWKF